MVLWEVFLDEFDKCLADVSSYFFDILNPFSFRAFSYSGFALLNSSSLQDKSDNRLYKIKSFLKLFIYI